MRRLVMFVGPSRVATIETIGRQAVTERAERSGEATVEAASASTLDLTPMPPDDGSGASKGVAQDGDSSPSG